MANKQLIGDFLKRIKRPINLIPDKDYKLVTIKMKHKGVVLRGMKKGSDIKSNMYKVMGGDFILSGIDARNGAFGIVPKELDGAIVTNDFWYFKIDESVIKKELFLELTSTSWFDDICNRGSDGTTQRIRLQRDKFFSQQINLPLPDVQEKLLVKIQTIKQDQFLLQQQNSDQLKMVTQLKQSILQEAIQGKLTEDWRKENPDVEPASELLKRIKAEKEQLVKDKKLKKGKTINHPLSLIDDIKIPDTWSWCKADEILFVTKLAGFEYTKHITLVAKGEIPVIRAQNVRPISIDKTNLLYIDKKTSLLLDRCSLVQECLLVTFIGAGIGDVATFNESERWHLAPNVAKMEPFEGCRKLINVKYLNYFLLSAIGRKEIFKHIKATAQPSLSMGTIRDIDFPIPPIEEQNDIVQKVEILMQKCQSLEEEIGKSESSAKMLMQAVLKEAFKG